MTNKIEERVSLLEMVTTDLAKANTMTNDVIKKLASVVSDEIKADVKKQFDEEFATREKEIESNVITTVSGNIDKRIRETLDERGLSKTDADRLTNARRNRYRELLGNSKGDEYKLFIPFYQYMFKTAYCKKFGVLRFADIEPTQLKEALDFTNNFTVTDRSWCIEALHNNYRNNEFSNNKLVHAYERYFGINVA